MATKSDKTGGKRKPAAVKKVAPETVRRCMDVVDTTALAWVSAIRVRVRDLVDDLDKVCAMSGHPHCAGATVVLKTAIDVGVLGQLFTHMDEAAELVDALLAGGALDRVPELARACRVAAAEMGLTDGEGGP